MVKLFYNKYLFVVLGASSAWNPVCKGKTTPIICKVQYIYHPFAN